LEKQKQRRDMDLDSGAAAEETAAGSGMVSR